MANDDKDFSCVGILSYPYICEAPQCLKADRGPAWRARVGWRPYKMPWTTCQAKSILKRTRCDILLKKVVWLRALSLGCMVPDSNWCKRSHTPNFRWSLSMRGQII